MSAQVVWPMRLDLAHGADVFPGNILDARERRTRAVETDGLEAVERLFFRQAVRQPIEIENVAAAAGDAEKRRRGPGRLNRHERRPGNGAGVAPQKLTELFDGRVPEQT